MCGMGTFPRTFGASWTMLIDKDTLLKAAKLHNMGDDVLLLIGLQPPVEAVPVQQYEAVLWELGRLRDGLCPDK